MNRDEKERLREQAHDIWFNQTRRGHVRPTSKQRDVMNAAYHAGVLPRGDQDYGRGAIAQWVEDNFPLVIG